jgi:hypothetical protein
MKHAGSTALDALEPLLARLRMFPALKEKTRGVFYLKSRAFLHFHEDPSGLWADIRAPGDADFDRLRTDDEASQRTLMARVEAALAGP